MAKQNNRKCNHSRKKVKTPPANAVVIGEGIMFESSRGLLRVRCKGGWRVVRK